jgi:hypothetical protein
MLYVFAEPCVLDVLCHPLRLAVCLLLVDSLVLSVVCVCVCVPFARLCQIFFILTVLSTVVHVTECIVKGFCSPALHHHIEVEN